FGEMVYFGRMYTAKKDLTGFDDLTDDLLSKYEKPVDFFDIYTDAFIYKYEKLDGKEWEFLERIENPWKKIPVSYYSIKQTPWSEVQPIIERLEEVVSNFGDTNDYFGSP